MRFDVIVDLDEDAPAVKYFGQILHTVIPTPLPCGDLIERPRLFGFPPTVVAWGRRDFPVGTKRSHHFTANLWADSWRMRSKKNGSDTIGGYVSKSAAIFPYRKSPAGQLHRGLDFIHKEVAALPRGGRRSALFT